MRQVAFVALLLAACCSPTLASMSSEYGEHVECPQPQSADWVDNVYMSHYTFVWADLAAEVAPYWDRNRQSGSQQRTFDPEEDVDNLRDVHRSAGPLKQGSNRRQAGTMRQAAQGSKELGARPQSANSSTAGRTADSKKAKLAFVDSPKFLAPTGVHESGRGFKGAQDAKNLPTDEALAVGPFPGDPDHVLVVHGIRRAWEIFASTKDGEKQESSTPTKIGSWQIMQKMGYNASPTAANFTSIVPDAFFDKKEGRYVISWSSGYYNAVGPRDGTRAPLFMCVSATDNALGAWTCWALDSVVAPLPFVEFCAGRPTWDYTGDTIKTSYSDDGIFVGFAGFCLLDNDGQNFLTALLAFPKKVLYTTPRSAQDVAVYRAMYLPATSWYRSLPVKDQLLPYVSESFAAELAAAYPAFGGINPFNSWVLPSLPTAHEDVSDPVFVLGKPFGGLQFMSFAKLTGEPLHKMVSRETAPKIYATVVGSGVNFDNSPGFADGKNVIPQPGNASTPSLDAGDVGVGGGIQRTYSASHHQGRVYVATSEYFGVGNARVPSIYWAVVDPSENLCKPSLEDWGLLASEQGLALAYPVIAPRDCGAFLAYAYGGNTTLKLDGVSRPAYAGVATSIVGCVHETTGIDVVKRGERVINRRPGQPVQRWGDNSAFSVCEDRVWFAVPVALADNVQYGSWIGVDRL